MYFPQSDFGYRQNGQNNICPFNVLSFYTSFKYCIILKFIHVSIKTKHSLIKMHQQKINEHR